MNDAKYVFFLGILYSFNEWNWSFWCGNFITFMVNGKSFCFIFFCSSFPALFGWFLLGRMKSGAERVLCKLEIIVQRGKKTFNSSSSSSLREIQMAFENLLTTFELINFENERNFCNNQGRFFEIKRKVHNNSMESFCPFSCLVRAIWFPIFRVVHFFYSQIWIFVFTTSETNGGKSHHHHPIIVLWYLEETSAFE